MDNDFCFSIFGFGFKIAMIYPAFLSCKTILESIKNEIKKEQLDKEVKLDVIENKFLDDDSI